MINTAAYPAYNKNIELKKVEFIKEQLLFVFKRLFENKKITTEEYEKAVSIIIKEYSDT